MSDAPVSRLPRARLAYLLGKGRAIYKKNMLVKQARYLKSACLTEKIALPKQFYLSIERLLSPLPIQRAQFSTGYKSNGNKGNLPIDISQVGSRCPLFPDRIGIWKC